MARLLQRLTGGERSIVSLEDYVAAVNQAGTQGGLSQSMSRNQVEAIGTSFPAYASGGLYNNAIVFACMAARQLPFSQVRFRYQRLRDGKPSDMFGSSALQLLETPGPGETTQTLLSRMIQDADLAGNSYSALDTPLTRLGGDDTTKNVLRLRPDWMEIVVAPRIRSGGVLGYKRVGYIYTEGGKHSGNTPVLLMPDEVAHFAPMPDPLAAFRGMSWLTPVVREIENDGLMNTHKRRFFENGATPNMIIKHPPGADRNKVLDFQKRLQAENAGTDNAYKTLNLYPGSDATVVGTNLEQLDFKKVQGAGETRIAAAGGIPPVIVGLSEGLEQATYSNYAQARRRYADGTLHPLWQNAAGALATIMPNLGSDSRLWYDADDIPFLREDEKDAAEITQTRAATLASLVQAGYTPESATKFLMTADDFRVLEHSGLYSVQLQPAGGSDKPEPDEAPARSVETRFEVHMPRQEYPAPVVNVDARAATPVVNVTTPDQPAPEVTVNVEPTPVTVRASDVKVNVNPTPVTVENRMDAPLPPDVVVNVEPTPITVRAADVKVNVNPTPVTVENRVEPTPVNVAAPEVHVDAPVTVNVDPTPIEVTVEPAAPEVRVDVQPAEVTVVPAGPRATRTDTAVHHNASGEITGSTAITETVED